MAEVDKKILTIAVVTYNQGHTIRECISSIALQTYSEIDLVIVDDYSCDFKKNEIESYIRSLNRSFCSVSVEGFCEHKGIVAAYNRALELAKGEYVLFIAGDDFLSSVDVLDRLADVLRKCERIDILQGKAVLLPQRKELPDETLQELVDDKNIPALLKRTLDQPFCQLMCIQSALIRTDWLLENGGFASNYQYVVDWPIYLKALNDAALFDFCDVAVTDMQGEGAFRSVGFGQLYLRKGYFREVACTIREFLLAGNKNPVQKYELECIARTYEHKVIYDTEWCYYSFFDRIKWRMKTLKRFYMAKKESKHNG